MGHPWWPPLWLLFWAALIGTAVWLTRGAAAAAASRSTGRRELLAERYARGELSGEEYRGRLEELTRSFQEGEVRWMRPS